MMERKSGRCKEYGDGWVEEALDLVQLADRSMSPALAVRKTAHSRYQEP